MTHDTEDTVPASEVMEAVHEIKSRSRKTSKADPDEPIQTDFEIPLFPDHDKNAKHVIAHLDVYKTSAPNDGYKGQFPPSSTLLHLGQVCGDGVFEIHAVSGTGAILRRRSNVKIAVGTTHPVSPRQMPPTPHAPAPDLTLLTFQREAHEKDAERIAAMARETSEQNREMTRTHTAMVQDTARSQVEREQNFFAAMMANQQTFMGAQMQMMREGFQQIMILQEQAHQRAIAANDPTTLMSVLMQGFSLAREAGTPEDPLSLLATTGVQGLKEIRSMMALKALGQRGTLGLKAPKPGSVPASKTLKAPTTTHPTSTPSEPTPDLASKLLKMKALVDEKNLDASQFLDDILRQLEALPPDDETPESSDSESGEEPPSA